jgi:membrane protein
MPTKAILFDIDGTLVDSNDAHVSAWDEVFRAAGHAIDRKRLHGQIGKGGDNYVPSLLPDLAEEEQQRLADEHGRVFKAKYMPAVKPFPGARELLQRARNSGRKVVLASSASGEELDHWVELLDASEIIDGATSKDDVRHSKPCPDIFEVARQKIRVAADEALVIGDTPYDIEAARRSGVGTIAVLSGGFAEEELRRCGARAIYDDVAALLADFDRSPIALQ